jgi:hypothetical protein
MGYCGEIAPRHPAHLPPNRSHPKIGTFSYQRIWC